MTSLRRDRTEVGVERDSRDCQRLLEILFFTASTAFFTSADFFLPEMRAVLSAVVPGVFTTNRTGPDTLISQISMKMGPF